MKTRHLFSTAAIAAAGAAAALLSSGIAYADAPAPAWMQPNLGSYSVPATAPAYVNGGDLLPKAPGTLGNPVQLVLDSSYGQAVGAPDANWGTQLQTQDVKQGAASETFYFQRMGTIDVDLPHAGAAGVAGVTAYRILHYSSNGVTCMDGYGGSPAAYTNVDLYGCDPNHADQTNQLWIIGRTADATQSTTNWQIDAGLTYPFGNSSTDSAAYTIENLSTVIDNDAVTSAAPVLSAATTNIRGYRAGLDLAATVWPAADYNSMWDIASAVIPPAANSNPSQPNCGGVACLITNL